MPLQLERVDNPLTAQRKPEPGMESKPRSSLVMEIM